MHGRPTPARLALLASVALAASARGQDGPIGFAPGSRAAQIKAEAHALAVPTPDAARVWPRRRSRPINESGGLPPFGGVG